LTEFPFPHRNSHYLCILNLANYGCVNQTFKSCYFQHFAYEYKMVSPFLRYFEE